MGFAINTSRLVALTGVEKQRQQRNWTD